MSTLQHVSSGRTVPLSKLRLDAPIEGGGTWTNIREFTGLDSSEIEALGKRIKVNGITAPLLVQQVRVDGVIENLVLDGQRRYLAARAALSKDAAIPVVDLSDEVLELTPELADDLTIKALTSIDREDLSSYELSTVAEHLKARGKTLDYIGKALNRDSSWVSKMLKARATAAPKLMIQWRKGEVTDEQFKELATVADVEEQTKATDDVVKARKSGDKTEARLRSKEIKEQATKKVTNGHSKHLEPANGGHQVVMFDAGKAKPAKPTTPKGPSRLVLEEFVGLADRRAPTADYVKGLFDGVRYAMGLADPSEFSKAWAQYINRVEGKPRPVKKAKAKKTGKAKGKRR